MKRTWKKRLYSAVFVTMLAAGLVQAVRKCSLRMTSAWNRTLDRFAYSDYRTKYYVGIKLDAYSGYRNHRVVWAETEALRKRDAESYRDYLLRHIPDFEGKLFIRKLSPIRRDDTDYIVYMATTPFIPKVYRTILESFASLLGAGRLIRASYGHGWYNPGFQPEP